MVTLSHFLEHPPLHFNEALRNEQLRILVFDSVRHLRRKFLDLGLTQENWSFISLTLEQQEVFLKDIVTVVEDYRKDVYELDWKLQDLAETFLGKVKKDFPFLIKTSLPLN